MPHLFSGPQKTKIAHRTATYKNAFHTEPLQTAVALTPCGHFGGADFVERIDTIGDQLRIVNGGKQD